MLKSLLIVQLFLGLASSCLSLKQFGAMLLADA